MLHGGCKLDWEALGYFFCSPRSQRIGGQWKENEVLPENPHSGRTVSRPNVRPVVTRWTYAPEPRTYGQRETGKPYFDLPSHSSCFPYFRVILVQLELIEGFPQIWRTHIFRSIQKRLSIQVSFNSHNAHCYFSYAVHIYFVY